LEGCVMFYSKKIYFLLFLVSGSFSLFGSLATGCYWRGSGHIYCFWNKLNKEISVVINANQDNINLFTSGKPQPPLVAAIRPGGSKATSTDSGIPISTQVGLYKIDVYDSKNNNLLCTVSGTPLVDSHYGSAGFHINPDPNNSNGCIIENIG